MTERGNRMSVPTVIPVCAHCQKHLFECPGCGCCFHNRNVVCVDGLPPLCYDCTAKAVANGTAAELRETVFRRLQRARAITGYTPNPEPSCA
jgi:hypothetical protein